MYTNASRCLLALPAALAISTALLGQAPERILIQPGNGEARGATDPIRHHAQDPAPARRGSMPAENIPEPEPIVATDFQLEVLDDTPDFVPAEDVRDEQGNLIRVARQGNPYVLDFTGGRYVPTAGVDPRLLATLRARPEGHTYGFVMLRGRMAPAKMRRLEAAGLKLLGVHTYQSVKARIPAASLPALQKMEFVHWVGYAQVNQKIDHNFAPRLAAAAEGEKIQFTVVPFDSDLNPGSERRKVIQPGAIPESARVFGEGATYEKVIPNGVFHRRLLELGFDFEEFSEVTYSFTGRMTRAQIDTLIREDWVHTVEMPPGEAEGEHDQAMPQVRQDYVRSIHPGRDVPAGIIDSGVDGFPWHRDFNGMYYVFWGDALNPSERHGTHVAGTMWGNGTADEIYTGAAPEAGRGGADNRMFISRWSVSDSTNIVNFGKNYTDSKNVVSLRPAVINCSYSRGTSSGGYVGTDDVTRAFDTAVYNNRQLYVFAGGNKKSVDNWWGSRPGVGKNLLTVGGVIDKFNAARTVNPGDKYASGRWGTLDRRTKPEVCAIGDAVTSCLWNSTSGYFNGSGTSMAAPMVTGCLMSRIDSNSWYRYRPEALKARAVASAKNRNRLSSGVWSSPQPGALTRQTTGWGLIDSRAMTFATTDTTAHTWGGTFTSPGQSWSGTFTVPSDAERIRMVLCYTEKAASSGATQARVNDCRSYLDFQPYTSGNTSGDFSAVSSRNNVIVRDNILVPGGAKGQQARIKVYAPSMPSPNVYWCVVVMVYKKNPAVTTTMVTATGDTYVQPNANYTLTASMQALANSDSFRSGRLWFEGSFTPLSMLRRTDDLIDQLYLASNLHVSDPFPSVGTGAGTGMVVGSGRNRPLTFNLRASAANGWHALRVRGTWGSNVSPAPMETATKNVCVDGQTPNPIANLVSTTHPVGGWSNKDDISFQWSTPTDLGCSGIHGLAWHLDKTNSANPRVIDALGTPTSTTFNNALANSSVGYYFHLASRDRAGNYSATSRVGPFRIDRSAPTLSSVTVANGQTGTSTLTVPVAVSAADALSGLDEIRYSGRPGVWGAWTSYASQRTVNLLSVGATAAGGVKTVSVQVRDRAGNVSAVQTDTIMFVPVPGIGSIGSATVNNTKSFLVVTGTNLNEVRRVRFGARVIDAVFTSRQENDWFGGRYVASSNTELRIYPPQNLAPGTYPVVLENSLQAQSNAVNATVVRVTKTNTLLNTEARLDPGTTQHLLVSRGTNPVGSTQITMFSGIAKPSTIPGFVTMGIGANWTNFVLLPRLPFDPTTGNSLVSAKVPAAASGVTLYFQTLFIDPSGQPLGVSAVRTTTYR